MAWVKIYRVPELEAVSTGMAPLGRWSFSIPKSWPSALYRAVFESGGAEANFAVRAADPGVSTRILVSLLFPTWQAYVALGVPYQGLYRNEQHDRALRASFDRPGCVPSRWERGFLEWLPRSGYAVEYCSGLDLHEGRQLLDAYQLLLCIGHDEYWSKEMRDTVEAFTERGGNVGLFHREYLLVAGSIRR